jgi:hypothetical protein
MDSELKIKVTLDGATIGDAKAKLKELNVAYNKIALDNIPLQKQLGAEIVKLKGIIAGATDATVTANGKMMKSYFSTGEELRRFYREQRVGDRTMREATQAVSGFSSMLGGEGLGKIVGSVTSRFQEMEFTMTGIGIAAQSSGGKFAGLGKTLVGLATPLAVVAAAIGLMYTVGEKVSAVYERLNKALDAIGKQSFSSASKETQVGMLDKQIRALMKEQNESPSFLSALGGGQAMRAEQLAQSIERQTKINELLEQRKKLEESISDDEIAAIKSVADMEQAVIDLTEKKKKEQHEKYLKRIEERKKAEIELAKFLYGTTDPNAPIQYEGGVKPQSQYEKFMRKQPGLGGLIPTTGKYVPKSVPKYAGGIDPNKVTEVNREFKLTEQILDGVYNSMDNVSNQWSYAIADMISGAQNIGQAFKSMGQAVIQELEMIIAKMIAMQIIGSIIGLFTGGASTAATAAVSTVVGGAGGKYGGSDSVRGTNYGSSSSANLSRVNKTSRASGGAGSMNFSVTPGTIKIKGNDLYVAVALTKQERAGRVG